MARCLRGVFSMGRGLSVQPVEGDSVRAEKPRLWSEGRYVVRGPHRTFDLHPDGTRFALAPVEQAPGVKQDHVTFLFNFFDELRRIAPLTKP